MGTRLALADPGVEETSDSGTGETSANSDSGTGMVSGSDSGTDEASADPAEDLEVIDPGTRERERS